MNESLTQIRHERSKKDFPWLSLHDDEYVEYAFHRAQVCLYAIISGTFFALVAVLLGFLLVLLSESLLDETGQNFVFIILGALLISTIMISVISLMVYRGNQLVVTNKRVIQRVMDSPVSSSMNIIDLGSIEDVSFHKNGLLQTLFGYGTLRLATVGDETSYTFKYSDIDNKDLDGIQKLIANAKKRTKRAKGFKEVEASIEDESEKDAVEKSVEDSTKDSDEDSAKGITEDSVKGVTGDSVAHASDLAESTD